MKAALLRAQVESALGAGFHSPFTFRERYEIETLSTGVPEVDALTGGLPRGSLTEISGPNSSGRTSLLLSVLAEITGREEVTAVVDAGNAFDPSSAQTAGVDLQRLLWVRSNHVAQALKAADFLVQAGGFGLVAVDLGDVPAETARRVPLAAWFRLQRAVENTPTVLIVLEQQPYAKTCASLVLRLEADSTRWSTAIEFKGAGFNTASVFPPRSEGRVAYSLFARCGGAHQGAHASVPRRLALRVCPPRSKGGPACPPHAHLLRGARLNVEVVRSKSELTILKSAFETHSLWSGRLSACRGWPPSNRSRACS
jgi:hypothetical protein